MAEFALGLTKTAVEGTLSLVKSAVEEEAQLKEKVQTDLVFIGGELEMVHSFLRAANNNRERARSDQVLLTSVRQLRGLAFDVEDCIEYILHLDLKSRWAWLRRAWQKVYCCAPPLPLDKAIAEIKQLKARVEDVCQRNTRYNLILHGSDNNNKQQQQPFPAMPLLAEEPHITTYPSLAAFHILCDAWKATGKWSSNMCNLRQELLVAPETEDDHDLKVISVWGSTSTTGGGGGGGGADLGTASIFRKAYCDPEICEKFRSRTWVKLTHPFNHDEFVKSLLTQFCASSHQANAEFMEGNLMRAKEAMMQQMRRQRYLVVLEDVLTVTEWDVIRMYLPNNKNGSRILLSTPQLGIAFLCTGEPYKVSELRNYPGDNQFLCAFSKQETTAPSDISKFYRQLLRGHGVISVWGADDDDKLNLVDMLYKGIINGWLEEIEGVVDKSDHVDMLYKSIRNRRRKIKQRRRNFFERHNSSWVDVPDPFNLKVFAQHLFLNSHSDDIRAREITEVGKKGEAGLIEWCRKFLSEEEDYPYVVVINGLQSKGDWDLIQSTFFSSMATTPKAGCILVIAKEESVATHCVKNHTHLAFNAKDLKADPSISNLINKGCWHYGIRGKKGRLFYDRWKDAQEWFKKFRNVGGINYPDEAKHEEEGFRVFKVTVDRSSENGGLSHRYNDSEKGVLRHAYYGVLFQQQIRCCRSWVDVSWVDAPLDLMDISWRFLLDFYSDDPKSKEAVAIGLMEGTIDPIEECREILGNQKCLVVINGLSSIAEWNLIKTTFFSEQHIQSIIFVGFVPMMRSSDQNYFCHTIGKALRLGTQEQGRLIEMEYRRIFCSQKKYQEAIQWVQTHQPVGRDRELGILYNSLFNQSHLLSVWGIPGVGKSTLVRTVYCKEILSSSGLDYDIGRHEAFAWVHVPSPFSLTEFAWRLLLDFYSDDPQAKETALVSMVEEGCQVPILECCKILRTGKCLVIMDGLRSKQDWNLIKATFLAEPIEANIIVVTNEEEELAMHCVENDKGRAINITRLEADAALSLMKKITYEKSEVPNSIVDKCGGLPKVIAAIGVSNLFMTLWPLSSNFMDTLERHPEFHSLRPLFSWMQSYFDACSDSIKPCIFYLSIFSAEKKIRRRRLLCRWIAEGYCRDTSDGITCEENGEKYISDLIDLSIVQWLASIKKVAGSSMFWLPESNKVFCQINSFFHEYIMSRPMEDNLVFALEGHCSLNSALVGQHLTIRSTWDRDRIVYESIDFSRLRSLTVAGKWESFFISSKNIDMRLLRVLDLEDTTEGVTNEDLEQIGKLLTRLKFLSLRGHTKINCLPSSMGGLRQLQTLDMRGTSIVTLPLFITKMQKLRYIRAGTAEVWDWAGDIISSLEATNLPIEDVDHGSASTEDEDHASQILEDGEDRASSSAQADTNLPPPAVAAAAPTVGPTPTEGNTDSTALVLPPDAAGSSVSSNNGARTLVSSLLAKLGRCGGHDNSNGGVKVPAGIQKLAVLHTLGVVNVNVTSAKSIFEALKQLTQLHKLGVFGINKGNIKEFCEAISGHAHLKSLSVEVDKDDNLDGLDEDDMPQPPKSINSLKLYGHVKKLLIWTGQLPNLKKLNLDMTIANPEELGGPKLSQLPSVVGYLRIRPIQDCDLHFQDRSWTFATVVEIQCRSILHIKFDDLSDNLPMWRVVVLKVHFSGGSHSSLQLSGLSNLRCLKEVWLKGYTDAHMQDMQRQIDEMNLEHRTVLKLVQPRAS